MKPMVQALLEERLVVELKDVEVDGQKAIVLSPGYVTSDELSREAGFLASPRYNRLHEHCDYSKGG